jgi:D-sedoheptulose 7-phosphate isomerase
MADGMSDQVQAFEELFARLPQLLPLREPLEQALVLLERCAQSGHKILLCGNGGSAADADHIAAELMKSFVYRRPIDPALEASLQAQCPAQDARGLVAALEAPVAAISLSGQVATLTAFSNDVDYRYAFAQQVYGLGRPGDVLVAISTSGNSANVLHACQVARARGLSVIGLTGTGGGRMRTLCDVALLAPAQQTHLIQELHLPLYHALCLALEERLFARHGKRC